MSDEASKPGREENTGEPADDGKEGGAQFSPEQEAIVRQARELLGEDLTAVGTDAGGALVLEVRAGRVLELLSMLKDEVKPAVSYLSDLHGVDGGDWMAVVYHLFRPGEAFEVTVKAITGRGRAQVPSVTGLWPGAGWPEREAMEMFGIEIVGHPDPRKLLLPDEWEGHPLRKDYKYPLDHPYLAPDPLHDNPAAAVGQAVDAEKTKASEVADDPARGECGGQE